MSADGEAAMDPRIALVLEEARTALQKQHDDLLAVRAKFSSLLTFAGATAALFAGGAFKEEQHFGPAIYVGSAAFAVVVLLALAVNYPRKFTFTTDARVMLDEWELDKRTVDETGRYLAGFLTGYVDENGPKIEQYNKAYVGATAAFLVEMVSFFLSLKGR